MPELPMAPSLAIESPSVGFQLLDHRPDLHRPQRSEVQVRRSAFQ